MSKSSGGSKGGGGGVGAGGGSSRGTSSKGGTPSALGGGRGAGGGSSRGTSSKGGPPSALGAGAVRTSPATGYSSLRDRFDGGGPGRSGPLFEGGPLSALGNQLGGPGGLIGAGIGSLVGTLALGPIGGLIGGFAGRQIGRNMGQQGPRDLNATSRMSNINFGDGGGGPNLRRGPTPAPPSAPAPAAPPPVMPIAVPVVPEPVVPTPVMPLYLANAFGAGSHFDDMDNELAMTPLRFSDGGDVRPGFFGRLAGLGDGGERRGLFGGLGSLFGMGDAGPDGPDPDRLAALREALDAGEISQDTYETMYARLLLDTERGDPAMGLLDFSQYITQAGQSQAPTQLSTTVSRGSSGSGTRALSRLGVQPLA